MVYAKISTFLELEEISKIEGIKGIVVDVFANWCGPCKAIAPFFEELSDLEEFSELRFVKIDTDESDETLLKQFEVTALPTFLFLGPELNVINKLLGANRDALRANCESLINISLSP
jgi:thioredoxin 1